MAKKLSPLVIPTVVDTSGITKGVRDINSRLRSVGGRAGAMGGGGFGTGVGGAGFAVSGLGGAGAAAMGAVFGAATSRINRYYDTHIKSAVDQISREENRRKLLANNPLSRKLVESQERLFKYARAERDFARGTLAAGHGIGGMIPSLAGLQATQNADRALAAAGRRQRLATGISNVVAAPATIGRGIANATANLRANIRGMNPMGLFGAGAPAGMAMGLMNNFTQDMQSRFANINNLTGRNYEIARNIQMTYQNQNRPTSAQAFWMGTRKASTGGINAPSKTEGFLATMGQGLLDTVGLVGQGVEMAAEFGMTGKAPKGAPDWMKWALENTTLPGLMGGTNSIGRGLLRLQGVSQQNIAIAEAMATAFKRNSI